jgi:hypothetical protein
MTAARQAATKTPATTCTIASTPSRLVHVPLGIPWAHQQDGCHHHAPRQHPRQELHHAAASPRFSLFCFGVGARGVDGARTAGCQSVASGHTFLSACTARCTAPHTAPAPWLPYDASRLAP